MQPFYSSGRLSGALKRLVMLKRFLLYTILFSSAFHSFSQGVGIPSKKAGIGFGNLPVFTGLRFNFRDKNVEKVNGINVTVWQPKNEEDQTGTVNGVSFGLPLAMGTENRNGLGVGILGVAARNNLSGIHIGGLGVGAGGDVTGLNVGGLGVGSGGDLKGINIGGLGAGSGGTVAGINIGGLGVGAGDDMKGFSFALLGAGAGSNVSGITVAGLGVGAGERLSGITIGGLGVGAGETVNGITIGGLGVGAGEQLKGFVVSLVAAGSPEVKAIAVAPVVGSINMKGLIIAPAYMKVGHTNKSKNENGEETREDKEGSFKGVGISAFNQVKGDQKGVTIGAVNYTHTIKGIQIGIINIVKDNPKGLRVLPIFNTRFGKKTSNPE
jgi:hypothetical protein